MLANVCTIAGNEKGKTKTDTLLEIEMANGNPVTRACKTVKTKTKTKRRNANVAVRCGQTMAAQSCRKSRTNETGRAFFLPARERSSKD